MEKFFLASDHRGGLQSPCLSSVLQEYVQKQWRKRPWSAAHICGESQTSVSKISYVRLIWLWNPDNIPVKAIRTTLTATWFQWVILSYDDYMRIVVFHSMHQVDSQPEFSALLTTKGLAPFTLSVPASLCSVPVTRTPRGGLAGLV